MPENSFQKDYKLFIQYLKTATQGIRSDYIQLPVVNQETPIYRERVYCYELYHQLRLEIEKAGFQYSLGGEIDKGGHPYIRQNHLDQIKPDILVHRPGHHDNLAVIEVKPVNVVRRGRSKEEIKKDLLHLTDFRRLLPRQSKYHYAIYLIYGVEDDLFDRIRATAVRIARDNRQTIDLRAIKLYWHRQCGEEIQEQSWNNAVSIH